MEGVDAGKYFFRTNKINALDLSRKELNTTIFVVFPRGWMGRFRTFIRSVWPVTCKTFVDKHMLKFLYIGHLVAYPASMLQNFSELLVYNCNFFYLVRFCLFSWPWYFFPLQVLFLMYHYFAATEIYNAIRVFIAAYVWMTGFGNFSYYYIRKDFSVARFAQVIYFCPHIICFMTSFI